MVAVNGSKQIESAKIKQKMTDTTDEITAKIAASYEKLAAKFREKAERASEHLKDTKKDAKRAMYRRRFELYGDAATDLDGRVRLLKGGSEDNAAD